MFFSEEEEDELAFFFVGKAPGGGEFLQHYWMFFFFFGTESGILKKFTGVPGMRYSIDRLSRAFFFFSKRTL